MFFEEFIVHFAQETVVTLRKLFAWRQLFVAHVATKTVDMKNAIVGSHHEIVLLEAIFTLETSLAK